MAVASHGVTNPRMKKPMFSFCLGGCSTSGTGSGSYTGGA